MPTPVEDLASRLERERLAADRRYNDALTALDAAVAVHGGLPRTPGPLDSSCVPELNHSWNILSHGAPAIDRSIKGRLRGLIWRIVGPPLETQRHFNALVTDYVNRDVAKNSETIEALAGIARTLSAEVDLRARFESLLVQYLQTITEYVDSKDRVSLGGDLRERVGMAEQRILALKREMNARAQGAGAGAAAGAPVFSGNVDSLTYVGFEDRFRGPQAEIRMRVEEYLPIFASASDVVDIGCGRGELLRALKERGIGARGVDANAGMVELCRAAGLDAELGDALSFLERQADASLGGLTAIQVVEHFEPSYLARVLEAAYHKLRPGAPIVLETINPACWMAFFETYIRDLTHQRPLHPDTLRYLVQATGFTSVEVQFRQPVGQGDRLPNVKILGDAGAALPRNVAQLADAVNAHADRLNAKLFSFMDYAVIARR